MCERIDVLLVTILFTLQSRRAGPINTTSTAAGILSSDCLRYGVPVQKELCTQRPCCQEHTGGQWEDLQGKFYYCCRLNYYPLCADCRLWNVKRLKWKWLLCVSRWKDSCEMDSSWGKEEPPCKKPIAIDTTLIYRPYTTRSTPLPVMCGVLVYSCMRYGAWDTSHLKA